MLGAAAGALLTAASSGLLVAQTVPVEATEGDRADEVFVAAGQVTADSYGLYLIDRRNRTICVYQWLPQTRKLRLMAARTYAYDIRLDDYNTEISPREVRELVTQQRRMSETPADR